MVGRVFGAVGVRHFQHGLFESNRVRALFQHMVQMEDVAQKMALGSGPIDHSLAA
jgi:hypothetical protein